MTVRVFESTALLTPAEVAGLPRQAVSSAWGGQPLSREFQWTIARDPKRLWFVASLLGGADFDRQHASGEFVEGLWERDVAELFIKERSGRYQEFNVSPGGAWWTVVLSSYRTREGSPSDPREPSVTTEAGEGYWTAVLGVEHACLGVDLSASSLLHVSGIAQKPQRHFLSSCPVPAVEPDFHHPEAFQPVALVAVP